MSKDAYYFSHDAGARNDERLLLIRSLFGWEGYGWFFAVCELFRESSDFTLSNNIALLKISLSIATDKFDEFIKKCFDLGLFVPCRNNNDRFLSESFMKRMELISTQHAKRVEAGRKGGLARAAKLNKVASVSSGAKALLKQVKETKVKETKVNELNTCYSFNAFWNDYGKKIDTAKCEAKWGKLSEAEKAIIKAKLPAYINATPDIQFRKNPLTYLNGKMWNDEYVPIKKKNVLRDYGVAEKLTQKTDFYA